MPEINCGFKDIPERTGSDALVEFGPTLYVDIGFDSKWKLESKDNPAPAAENIEALVDTGATISCIDDALAQKLGLPIIDQRSIGGVGGELMANIYLAQIHVASLDWTIYGDFAGVHLTAGGQFHQALLGRTFLQHHKMTYDGVTGNVILSR